MSVVPDLEAVPDTARHAGWLAEQLPRPLAEDPFLQRFLCILETTTDSVHDRIDAIEHLLDPDLAPPEFVRMLGAWLGVVVDAALPEGRQRQLVHAAGETLPWRGTRRGLRGLLEALTGATVEVRDHGGVFPEGGVTSADPTIEIRLADTGGVDEQHLLALARAEAPANAVVVLLVDQHVVAAGADDAVDEDSSQAEPEPLEGTGYLPPVIHHRRQGDDGGAPSA